LAVPLPQTVHFETWVALRKNRDHIRRGLRKTYRIARRITQANGGYGPWTFIVNADPVHPKTPRLRKILGLKLEEDLWMELVFYPNKARMKRIIRQIWNDPEFAKVAGSTDKLLSKRKIGYEATLAYGSLQQV
jgi:hypothetical protein